jgi:hypothetical protein
MPFPSNGDGLLDFSGLLFHSPMSSNLPSLFSFEVLSFNLLPFLTLLSSNLPSYKLLSSKLMHSSDLLHFFKLLHSSQLLPFIDLLPFAKLLPSAKLFSELPSPTLLFIIKPCLAMPSFKVPSHQHSFIVHELDSTILFLPTTFIIPPTEHPTSSSSVHAESPMSTDKLVNLNAFPYIESNPNLLHQVLHFKSSRNHMIALANSNLNKLQSSHGLKESLLLMAFYTMFDVRFVALLT